MAKFGVQQLRTANQQLVLRGIYHQGPLSRADLARRTQLSRPSISNIVRDLLAEGLIEEQGYGSSNGGKPPILLNFLDNALQIAAVDLSGEQVEGVLTDLRSRVQLRVHHPLHCETGPAVLESLHAVLDRLVAQHQRPLLGIGVSTPGLVDTDSGVVRYAANLHWEELPLAELIHQRYGVRTWVGNDANMAAIGELRFGVGQGDDSLVLIQAGLGVGAGVVVNGDLYLGAGAAAGEVGFMTVVPLDDAAGAAESAVPLPPLPANLEIMAGQQALLRQARALAAQTGIQVALDGHAQSHLAILLASEPICTGLSRQIAPYVGAVVGQFVNLLHPHWIVLGGNLKLLGPPFLDLVHRHVNQMTPPWLRQQSQIVFSTGGEDISLKGVTALILAAELGVL